MTTNKNITTLLWLDDIRNPFTTQEVFVPKAGNIIWVRNYEQFVQIIEKIGLTTIISFDHDLSDEHYHQWMFENPDKYNSLEFKEKTGFSCAKWLIDYCIDNNLDLPEIYVHSMNPVGKENIEKLINNYKLKYDNK